MPKDNTISCIAEGKLQSQVMLFFPRRFRHHEQMKRIKEAEGIHKTQSCFSLGSKKPLGGRKGGGVKMYSPPQTATASPAQMHRRPGPVRPNRMSSPSSFHHPPQDNAGGREQDFQAFVNAPLRVPLRA